MTTLDTKNMSAVKLALLSRQLRSQTEGFEFANVEPIAVVGMGCRFPGGANNPALFWELLKNGVDAICEVPPDRWNIDELFDPDPAAPGKMTTRWGGFLQSPVDQFDASFFGISPREASRMDPQQRLLLEVAWEAAENAGQTQESLSGSQTGVFIASYHNDYSHLLYNDLNEIDAYSSTGTGHSIVANRLSFLLNLHGPSITVDTACSSSLVAVHLAVQSLRRGECNMALAGGVSLMLTPEVTISLSKWGFMAEDGRCKTFDARANGFVRGEGCGVIALKRLTDALADGDTVLALIRGSAVNQDGRTNVLTAPSGLAQQQVIRQALANGLVEPEQISYIEAHGTGTSLGDPIEVEALTEVIGKPRPNGQGCYLASVKTNLGHLEAAAGIAGLIKVVLCMQHGEIPSHLHFTALNPHISLDNTPFVIPTEMQPWTPISGRRFAGVSSFGFGGTNGHIVLEEAPQLPQSQAQPVERPYLLPLSAHTPEAAREMAARFAAYLGEASASVRDITYTASLRRTHHDYRLAAAGQTREELAERLDALARGNQPLAPVQRGAAAKVAFVFSGQGPQWWAMGRELLETEPVFREVIERCDSLLRPYAGWPLLDELLADEAHSRLDQTEVAQPAIFALQAALTALWRSWGVVPDAVVGHSIGEVTAAYIASVLRLEDAIRVVYHRARLMQAATGNGKMASVEIGEEEAKKLAAEYGDRLSIAAVNSPTTTVLSGEPEALENALNTLQARGVSAKMLRVNYAFHSAQMESYARELSTILKGLKPTQAVVPIYSTVTGQLQQGQGFDAGYWGRNVRQPVRFATAVGSLIADGYEIFLEISPHPVLGGMIAQCLEAASQDGKAVASLRRGRGEQDTMLAALGELYALGLSVNWETFYPSGGKVVALPTYPWQRERHWFEPSHKMRKMARFSSHADVHPLLQSRLRSPALQGVVFESRLTPYDPAFLNDHRIWSAAIVPAAAYLDAVLSAAQAVLGERGRYDLADVLIQEALSLPEDGEKIIQLHLKQEGDTASFQCYSLSGEDAWTLHASGRVGALDDGNASGEGISPESIQRRSQEIPVEEHYRLMREKGIEFGPTFQGLEQLWRGEHDALGLIHLPDVLAKTAHLHHIHPALLDACLQPLAAVLPGYADADYTYLPVNVETLRFYRQPDDVLWSYAQVRPDVTSGAETLVGDVRVFDPSGTVVLEGIGLRLKRASRQALQRIVRRQAAEEINDWFHDVVWQPVRPNAQPSQPDGAWLIFADGCGVGAALAQRLGMENCILVEAGESNQRLNDRQYQANPTQPEAFKQLVTEVLGLQPNIQIVHLWSLDIPSLETTRGSLLDEQEWSVGSALYLTQALASANQPSHLWLATRGAQAADGPAVKPEQAPLWGFENTAALEHPDMKVVLVDIDPSGDTADAARRLFDEIGANDGEDRVALRGENRFAMRLVHHHADRPSNADIHPVHLDISARGVLDNLEFVPMTRRAPEAGEIELRVLAAGLNFRDVLKALGMYPGDPGPFGDECVGEVTAVGAGVNGVKAGDIVVGIAPDSFATYAITKAELVIHKPDFQNLEEAATLPTFLTAYYALHHLGQVAPGDKVLIHAAAGGVGMTAVQLALRAGAEVFATAGSPEKRAFLKSLGVPHVMDSRSLDFADEVMQITSGRGVDVVLNSLAGEFIPKSLSVLADQGRFLEIGKTGIWTAEQVTELNPTLAYHIIFFSDVIDNYPEQIQAMLCDLALMMEAGELRPLPRQVFPMKDAVSAFRYMAQAKHIGKIVLTQPAPVAIRADATYLITGGTGGIGLHIARWLVEQGARYLVLSSRSGDSDAVREVTQELQSEGAQVVVMQADAGNEADVSHLIAAIEEQMPPLRGIVHAAGIVDDGILLQQDWARFAKVLSPKMQGVWNLHRLAQGMALDFMVVFSSASSVLGSPGQANYAAANAFLDAFAGYRQAQGFPCLSINWGAWENTGMTAALGDQGRGYWTKRGLGAMPPELAAAAFGRALERQTASQIVIMLVDRTRVGQVTSPLFKEIASGLPAQTDAHQQAETQSELLRRWSETAPNRRRKLLLEFIRDEVIRVLGLRSSQVIDPRQPLNELGLDSLMAVEMRNALSAAVAAPLPATVLFDYPTSDALVDYLTSHVPALMQAGETELAAPEERKEVEELREISDEEAEALLLAELDELNKGKKHG